MTKVSTITPCYNMARYMEGFLVNLAEQTYEDLEIVLDHNNPTDEEVAMVESYNEIHGKQEIRIFLFTSCIAVYYRCNFCNLFHQKV